MLCLAGQAGAESKTLVIDDFEQGLSPRWQEKSFKDHTRYEVVPEGGGKVLRAESREAASALLYEIPFDPAACRTLTWRWKVENILEKGDERFKEGDDYAARVYVVFPSWYPPATRSLNYIWANKLPKDGHVPNPFFANAVMVAAESGAENVGKWMTESRDIVEDFRRVFGEDPPKAGAVALMTDTDNTGGAAVAYYDDIRLECR
jgi:hypothetical protein